MARPSKRPSSSYKTGLWAESVAGMWLCAKGYRVLARRFKTPVGEIDVIVRRGTTLVFVEVKRRGAMNDALAAISAENAARVRRASEWWLKQNQQLADKCDIRFDVVACAPYAWPKHIPNAF